MMLNFDTNVYIIAREILFYLCKKRPGTVRISYNARYVTTQEKILKKRPVPGRLSNSPVICKSLKLMYGISFICDQSIKFSL